MSLTVDVGAVSALKVFQKGHLHQKKSIKAVIDESSQILRSQNLSSSTGSFEPVVCWRANPPRYNLIKRCPNFLIAFFK
jgi:hypothetical protein